MPAGGTRSGLSSSRFARLCGSIRGRFIFAAGLFCLILFFAAWFAQQAVNEAAQQKSGNVELRQNIFADARNLSRDLWATENAMQSYLLNPGTDELQVLKDTLDELLKDADTLSHSEWARASTTNEARAQNLLVNAGKLQGSVLYVAAVRDDATRLFPAMPHMLQEMLPRNVEFDAAASLALQDLLDSGGQIDTEVYRHFTDARFAWSQAISALRMYVANRFGIFPGSAEAGMRAQVDNIHFHLDSIQRSLRALAALHKKKRLGPIQEESLSAMQAASQRWRQGLHGVRSIFEGERWRTDIPLLRDIVRPNFNRLWATLDSIMVENESGSAGDVTSLTTTAGTLTDTIWFIALLGLALTLSGYVLFEMTVSRPLRRVARALVSESQTPSRRPLPTCATTEIRDLVEAFESLRHEADQRRERMSAIVDNTAEAIITFDESGKVESVNHAAASMFGWSESEATQLTVTDLIIPPDEETEPHLLQPEHFIEWLSGREEELQARHRDSGRFPVIIKVRPFRLGERNMYTALVDDNSERKALMDHLRHMAEHDGLTGLYNRGHLMAELTRTVDRAQRDGPTCALLYIDLDNFKYVNDTLGHAAGDRLLIEVAGILHRRARRGDLVARLGGDEFTVLLYDTHLDMAWHVADSFRQALSELRQRGAQQTDIGCSIGVALIEKTARSAEDILARADLACHLAKRGGRNSVHVFDPADESRVTAMSLDMGWTRRIKEAIERDLFVMVRQPIIAIADRSIHSSEILLRMRDEHGELIMPSGFLPTAERFGLMPDIDKWVIMHAIEHLARQHRTEPATRYSINLSAPTLLDPSVLPLIQNELKRHALAPGSLIVELTENVAVSDIDSAGHFLTQIRELGCVTALDDFGSGMSSFTYLRELPVDLVKIDGHFVRHMATNPVDQSLVRAMNDIAHTLGKRTVAEFVENEETLHLLESLGVDYAQGYHLGRPSVIIS